MVNDAPAEKPVISTYPPRPIEKWKGFTGYRTCDSEFAKAQNGECDECMQFIYIHNTSVGMDVYMSVYTVCRFPLLCVELI